MCADRVASFVIGLDADSTDIRTALSGLRTQFQSAVSDIAALSRRTNVFEGLEQSVSDAAAALAKAKQDVTTFTGALEAAKGAGKDVTKELQASLAAAQKATTSATNEYNRQVDSISKLQSQLSRAGIDTSNLAASQAKLAEQSAKATNAAANQAAQQLLGLKTVRDTTPEIQKLYAAYNTLAVSGTLSAKELAVAQAQLQTKVAETRAGVTGLGTAAATAGPSLASMFTGAILPALTAFATIGSVIAGIKSVVDAGKEFKQGLAEISTVSNLSQEQIAKLGAGARELARDLGVDVNDAIKQVAALLRSGVPEENVLEVLRVSAVAAKASVTDLGDGVKAADVLISGLGVPIADLGRSLDIVVQGAKDGGITLKEFAENGGSLVNIARAANVPLTDLIATLKVMVNAGLDASTATGDLGRIIAKLRTDEAKAQLESLGITTTNLVEVFQQLAAKGLSIDKVLDLGVASTKSAGAISALTNNAADLGPELERLGKSAGLAKTQLDGLIDSPKEKSDRFNAAWEGFKLRLSETIGTGSTLGGVLTDVLNRMSDLSASTHGAADQQAGFIDREIAAIKALFGFSEASVQAKTDTDALAVSTAAAGEESRKAAVKTTEANNALTAASAKLLEQVAAMQSASARAIGDVNTLADNQLAALDKSAKAIAATTSAALLIQQQAADARLKIITENEEAVTKATDAAVAARIKSLQAAGKAQTDIDAEVTKIRLGALTPILAQYQDHYSKLTAQAQEWAGKVNAIEEGRIAFNQSVEKTLFDIRVGGLSAFDQYLAKVKEVERLISEARIAGAQGNIKVAEDYTKQAIALATSIGSVVSTTGVKIVTDLQAQETKVGLVKKAADGLNQSYTESGDAAHTGQVLAEVYQNRALANLLRMQIAVDELNAKAAAGLKVSVELNEEKVKAAQATLDELSRDRTVTITVNTVQGSGGASGTFSGGATGSFAQGGPVGKLANVINTVRQYAGGGSVFRDPTWTKVPGVGNGDTVPARLSIGSFVMRKAASSYYGDTLMGLLAGRYADGGSVSGGILTGLLNLLRGGGALPFGLSQLAALGSGQEGVARSNTNAADVVAYAKEVLARAGNSIAAQGVFGLVFKDIESRIRFVEGHPTSAQAVAELLKSAASMGANLPMIDFYGKTSAPTRIDHEPFSFADFVAEWAGRGGGSIAVPRRFAAGGGVDSVPAYLTPGEYVLKPSAVSNVLKLFGGGFLDAMNSMRVPKGFLDGISNIAPPRPLAFANGGSVPGGPLTSGSSAGSGPVRDIHLHFSSTKMDADEVRRTVIPEIRKVMEEER